MLGREYEISIPFDEVESVPSFRERYSCRESETCSNYASHEIFDLPRDYETLPEAQRGLSRSAALLTTLWTISAI